MRSDPDLLRSLLQNLIGNALAYTARGTVLVGVQARRAACCASRCGTRARVPEHAREVIFKDFLARRVGRRHLRHGGWGSR